WASVPASYQFTHWSATIPMLPWGTSVDYFATITDYAGHMTISDNGGNDYNFVVGDDINPIVTLDSPADGSLVIDTILINVTASDVGSNIARVEFFADSTSVFNDTTAPYSLSWDSRTVSNGTHTLFARAYDNEGLMSEDSVSVDVQNDVASPLTYSLMLNPSQPKYGQSATVTVTVLDASDIDSVILYYAVESYSPPSAVALSQSWQSVAMTPNGPVYTGVIPAQDYWNTVLYYVAANDEYNQTTYIGTDAAPFEYDVGDNTNPSLSINGPADGSSIKGTVVFTANAVDEGSGIDQIRFYLDDVLMDSSGGGASHITWDTTQYENGEHIVVFEAADHAGNVFGVVLTYTVENPDAFGAIGEVLSDFMSSYGFFVGAGVVILGYGFVRLFMNRRAAGGKPKSKKKS
ncbi:MAG: Ig-like domain-containing protein, partial [Candidatus Thorarchaeota archaeon]